MANDTRLTVTLGAEIRNFAKKIKEANATMEDFGNNLKDHGEKIGQTFGTMGLAIAGGLGLAVKKSADFEQALADIRSVAPEVSNQMDEVKQLALDMGAKTKYSALEAAKGMEELIKAGVNTKDIMKGGLQGALDLATAGELDLADAAEIASTALNAFKDDALTVTQAANILAGGANASATSVGELKYGLSAVSAVASGVGLSFNDTVTTLSLFAQNGLKGADAGTSLKTMLMNLVPHTKDAAETMEMLGLSSTNTNAAMKFLAKEGIKVSGNSWGDAAKGIYKFIEQEYGLAPATKEAAKQFDKMVMKMGFVQSEFFDANGEIKDMASMAGILQNAMKDLNPVQRQVALNSMFGSDAIRAGNILFKEGAKGVTEMNKAMSKTTAADVAKTKMDTLKGQVEQLSGSIETLAIQFGDALMPAVKILVGILSKVVDVFSNMSPRMKSTIAIGAAVAAGLMLLVSVVGFLVMGLGALITAEYAAMAPAILIIAVVVAVIAAFVLLYNKFEGFRNVVNKVFTFAWNIIKQMLAAIVNFVKEKLDQIKKFWDENGAMITQAIKNVWGFIAPIIKVAMTLIRMIIVGTWNAIKNVINGVLNVILGLIKFFAALFTGNWSALWEATKQILKGLLEAAWGIFQLTFGRILKFLGGFIGKFLGAIGGWVGKVLGWFKGLFGKAGSFVSSGIAKIKNFFDDLFLSIATKISNWSQGVANAFLNIVTRIQTIFSKVFDILTAPYKKAWEVISKIVEKIKGVFDNLKLKIPMPKMPHLSIDIKTKKILGKEIPVPDFNLDWYKTGGVFNGASVIGVGEQPGVKEAAMPLSGRHMQPFAEAVAKWMPGQGKKAEYYFEVVTQLDGREVSRRTVKYDEQELDTMKRKRNRAKGDVYYD